MRRTMLSWLLFWLLATAPARSQQPDLTEKSLEELMNITVSTASKHEQAASDAPAAVTVITADEIRKYGYRTLADILRSVRSFYVTYDRNYSYIGFRGFSWPGDYNTRILLLVNGHRLNDNIYDRGAIGAEFPVDVDLVERVEVIRGAASSLYGSNAFFGVINVITKRGQDLDGIETSVSTASFGSFQGRASYGKQYKEFELLISGTIHDSRGQNLFFPEFNNPETNNGIAVHADDDQFTDWMGRVSWRGFTLEGLHSSREKGIPTAPLDSIFNDRRNRAVDERRYLDLSYEHTLGRDWLFSGRLSYDQFRFTGTYVMPLFGLEAPGSAVDVDYDRGQWWGTELRVSRELMRRHRVSVGGEFRDNVRQLLGNYLADPFVQYFRKDHSSLSYAGYVQDEFTLSSKVILNAGFRYDHYEVFGGTVNPRAGLMVRPWEHTTIKLLYGSAFRALNMDEQYYAGPGYEPSRVGLKPEIMRSSEVVFERRLGKHHTFTWSGFYNQMNDLVSEVLDPVTGNEMVENVATVRARGMEFEFAGKYANGLEGRASYSLQDAVDDAREPLSNSPKHLGKFNLIVPLVRQKLFAGVEAQYTSRRRTLDGGRMGGYPSVNATVFNTRLLNHFDISASVYNLFDRKYADPGSIGHEQGTLQQDGRNFRVKLTWTWQQL